MGCGSSRKYQTPKPKSEKMTEKDKQYAFKEVMDFMSIVPLFKRLPASDRPQISSEFMLKEYAPRSIIIKQGDDGNEFFVIKSGDAQVIVSENVVATLKRGDYFGEGALLRNEPRNATIVAADGTEHLFTLSITRESFEKMGLQNKVKFARRQAVGVGGPEPKAEEKETAAKGDTRKTPSERGLIVKAIKSNTRIMDLLRLDEEQIGNLTDVAWKRTVPPDTNVTTQGDVAAEHFFIVASGSFAVYKTKSGISEKVATISHGRSFGELALLYHAPRAATVASIVESELWVVAREDFKKICLKRETDKKKEISAIVEKIELFSPLLDTERLRMVEAMAEVSFKKDEVIIEQGADGDSFWLLTSGRVDVVKDDERVATLEADFQSGLVPHFGEAALINNDPRSATIKVISSTAKALVLDRVSFDMILGSLKDLLGDNRDTGTTSMAPKKGDKGKDTKETKKSFPLPKRDQLRKVGLLGCGAFGTVTLEKDLRSQRTFAMKTISKGYIVKMGLQESVFNEKSILEMTDSPFIIKLFCCYASQQNVMFLMEVALGGELFSLYSRKNFHGKEEHAKFYSACVALAFDHLHERRIIYRDLKPENLLLSQKGICKLADMGLAKFCIGKTFTTCGTPDYFAPEIITGSGHNRGVDWWALGVLIFELLCGHPPFETSDPMLTYKKIMQGIESIRFPKTQFDNASESVILNLCKHEVSERMPMRPSGMGHFRKQDWYNSLSWEKLISGEIEVPYRPKIKSVSDCSNFFASEEDLPAHVPYNSNSKDDWDKDFATAS